jgi:hypothetical protein
MKLVVAKPEKNEVELAQIPHTESTKDTTIQTNRKPTDLYVIYFGGNVGKGGFSGSVEDGGFGGNIGSGSGLAMVSTTTFSTATFSTE